MPGANKINEFKMANFNEFLNYLFSMPSNDGKVFERYCKWFLENDSRYAMQLKTVWLWKDWPGNWGKDKGIDLIAETKQGEFWAIQAKAYNKNYYITKKDVDKFLSESSRKQISFRLLISTTNHIGANAQEVMQAQEKLVGRCLLNDLEYSILDWPPSVEKLFTSVTKDKKSPRPHQEKAINDIVEGFKKSWHGQLHMACGTGKTLVALWVSERLSSHNTLVLVPSISLVSQIYKEWAENANKSFNPILVCSDSTVNNKNSDNDEMKSNASELGFPITTNPSEIVKYFASNSNSKIVFSTYHSSPVIAEVCRLCPSLKFDLVVADEAHRCAGTAKSDFATIVNQTAIKTTRKLFMTATPKIFSYDLKQKTKEVDYEIVSMDDEDKFGPVFHRLSFSEAIKQDLLSDYQVLISVMDNDIYREYAKMGRFISVKNHEIDARTFAGQVLVAKAIKKLNLKRIISFHSRKIRAKEFVDTFKKIYPLLSEDEKPEIGFIGTIFGEMPQDKRLNIMRCFDDLQDGISGLIANVRCLSEGVDVPALDGIVFIDPKGSEIDIVQAVGRAIRKAPNKKIGTIIIPVFVDKSCEEIIDSEQACFQTVWKVVKALRSHDDVLAEELDNLRLELGKRIYKKTSKLSKILFDVPIKVGKDFCESLTLKIVEQCSRPWEFYYGLLIKFVEKNGNAFVPTNFNFCGYNLGSWVSIQRKKFNKGELSCSYIKRLESLQEWVWDALDSRWNEGFRLLNNFHKKNGHVIVPPKYTVDNFNLSSWISIQRKTFKNGKLSADRKIRLENLSGWSWSVLDSKWNHGIRSLSSFYRRENHLDVPYDHVENGHNLGVWIRNRKRDYLMAKLSKEKQKILEDFAGWTWERELDIAWNMGFALLQKFVKEFCHSRVPRGYSIEGFSLATWVSSQRRAYVLKNLSQERIVKLEALNGWAWNVIDYKHNAAFEALDTFVLREGHAFVSTDHTEFGFPLGKWVSRWRLYYAQNKIDQDIKLKLESLPDWVWDANLACWERGKKLLVQFYDREKHFLVKHLHTEKGFPLGRWCQMYRYQYKQNKLPQDKLNFFNSLIGWSWNIKVDQWNIGLEYLKKYVTKHGDAKVASNYIDVDGFNLGTWVCTQKYAHSKGKILNERCKLLETFPGWTWNVLDEKWMNGYKYLQKFIEKQGNANVPAIFKIDDFNLGVWIGGQRYSYKQGKLSLEKISLLENLFGWTWAPKNEQWLNGYNKLMCYYRREGHARVPFDHVEDSFNLGEWVLTQRKAYKSGKVEKYRISKLESLNGWVWNTRKKA